jgi:hypothetical protein
MGVNKEACHPPGSPPTETQPGSAREEIPEVQRTYVPCGHTLTRRIPTIMYLARGLAYEASCFWSTMGIRTLEYGILEPGDAALFT